jgi:hypothetical protein
VVVVLVEVVVLIVVAVVVSVVVVLVVVTEVVVVVVLVVAVVVVAGMYLEYNLFFPRITYAIIILLYFLRKYYFDITYYSLFIISR